MGRSDVFALKANDLQVCPVDIGNHISGKPTFLMKTVDILSNQPKKFAVIVKLFEKYMGFA